MRIRKYASSLVSAAPATTTRNKRLCSLNLSPWDVTPFTAQSEFEYQFEITDEFMCNSAGNELVCAPERVLVLGEDEETRSLSSLDVKKLKVKKKAEVKKREDGDFVRCVKTDGKTWQCKKEAQQGEVLCQHHLVQLQSYQHKYYRSTKKAKARVVASKKRNRGRVQTKPAEFYYYSGFGPSRGKRRRGDEIAKEELRVNGDAIDRDDTLRSLCSDREQATSSQGVHIASRNHDDRGVFYDYEDEDEDEEDEEGHIGKKRIRRRIKARSLKSLF